MRDCAGCNNPLARSEYSKNQWAKGSGISKCKTCVSGSEAATGDVAGGAAAATSGGRGGQTATNGSRTGTAAPKPACANCNKSDGDLKLCTGCRHVHYCGRDCQLAHRKAHKKRCKELEMECLMQRMTESLPHGVLPEPEAHLRGAAAVGNRQPSSTPSKFLDLDLVPFDLWRRGVALVNEGDMDGAAWNFLLGLFMDFGLDGNQMTPAINAIAGCDENDPVAMALSITTWQSQNRHRLTKERHLGFIEDVCKRLESDASSGASATSTAMSSIDQVNRNAFAVGAAKLFHARILARYHYCTNPFDAHNRTFKAAHQKSADIINTAKTNFDPDRWLTLQYELGYSSFDTGNIRKAKQWLQMVVKSLKKEQTERGAVLSGHWLDTRASAEQKLQMVPMMEQAKRMGRL